MNDRHHCPECGALLPDHPRTAAPNASSVEEHLAHLTKLLIASVVIGLLQRMLERAGLPELLSLVCAVVVVVGFLVVAMRRGRDPAYCCHTCGSNGRYSETLVCSRT